MIVISSLARWRIRINKALERDSGIRSIFEVRTIDSVVSFLFFLTIINEQISTIYQYAFIVKLGLIQMGFAFFASLKLKYVSGIPALFFKAILGISIITALISP
jgi:hypothetical protein